MTQNKDSKEPYTDLLRRMRHNQIVIASMGASIGLLLTTEVTAIFERGEPLLTALGLFRLAMVGAAGLAIYILMQLNRELTMQYLVAFMRKFGKAGDIQP